MKKKFIVKVDPEQSVEIQDMLFKKGIFWRSGQHDRLMEFMGFHYLIISPENDNVYGLTWAAEILRTLQDIPISSYNTFINDIYPKLNTEDISKPKSFMITGKPYHLSSIIKDLGELGYITKVHNHNTNEIKYVTVNNFEPNNLAQYKVLYAGKIGNMTYKVYDDYIKFNLPEDYSNALIYAKDAFNSEYWKKKNKVVYFGDVAFTIVSKTEAQTDYGSVNYDEIRDAINYLHNPPKLAGNPLTIHIEEKGYARLDTTNNLNFKIGFGCKEGSITDLINIKKAMDSYE